MIFLKVEQRYKDWMMNRESCRKSNVKLKVRRRFSLRSQHDWDWLQCSRTWWRDCVPPASWFVFVYCSVSSLLTFILNSDKSDNQNQTFIVRSQQERVRNKNTIIIQVTNCLTLNLLQDSHSMVCSWVRHVRHFLPGPRLHVVSQDEALNIVVLVKSSWNTLYNYN